MSERQLYPPPPELLADGPCISNDLPQLSPDVSDRDTVMLTLPLQLVPVQCTSTGLGLYPIVNSQYRSTTLYQVSYQIQSLFIESDNRRSPCANRRGAACSGGISTACVDIRGRAVIHHWHFF